MSEEKRFPVMLSDAERHVVAELCDAELSKLRRDGNYWLGPEMEARRILALRRARIEILRANTHARKGAGRGE